MGGCARVSPVEAEWVAAAELGRQRRIGPSLPSAMLAASCRYRRHPRHRHCGIPATRPLGSAMSVVAASVVGSSDPSAKGMGPVSVGTTPAASAAAVSTAVANERAVVSAMPHYPVAAAASSRTDTAATATWPGTVSLTATHAHATTAVATATRCGEIRMARSS